MGSIRTWSLALVAGVFVVVVAHQRSVAGSGAVPAAPTAPAQGAPVPGAPGSDAAAPAPSAGASAYRVTGLPDFSGLVAEYGPAVVKVSVVEKPQKLGSGGEQGDEDPLSQFFHHFQMPKRKCNLFLSFLLSLLS